MMKTTVFRTLFLLTSMGASWALARNNGIDNHSDIGDENNALTTQTVSGNSDCAAASATTSFALSFISYGNYTSIPGEGDDEISPPQLMSMSFAVSNAANGAYTICAFPLGHLSVPSDGSGAPATWVDNTAWQACADRKDSDGKHLFTIATSAAFALTDRSISVNQTWFCHDGVGQLVAYTGIANGTLNLTCADGGKVGGYHLQNCTSLDVALPVTLL